MAKKSGSLDYWRNFFRTANSDIFGIIDHAIMVAASDCPKEFRLRRDRIAERVFSCRLTRCSGCDKVELAVPGDDEEDDDDRGCKSAFDRDGGEFEAGASKESKVNSSRDDQAEMNTNQVSNHSYGEAEALTDEIEETSQIIGEVFRIKEIFQDVEETVYLLQFYLDLPPLPVTKLWCFSVFFFYLLCFEEYVVVVQLLSFEDAFNCLGFLGF